MKNLKLLTCSSLILLTLGGSLAYGLSDFPSHFAGVKGYGDPTPGLTISAATLNGENKVNTRFGNEVDIRGVFTKSSSINLEENGYIGNYSSIRGMNALTVTFSGEGSLECWVGYKQGILYQVSSSITSGASVSLPHSPEARFFKLQSSGGSTSISSISIDLSCPDLGEETDERLTNYTVEEGAVTNSSNNGSALTVFSTADAIGSIDLQNKGKTSIRALSIDGTISFSKSFNANFGVSIIDLSGWTSSSLPAYSFYSASNFRLLLSASTTTIDANSLNYSNEFTVYSMTNYSGSPITVSGGTAGARTGIQAKVRYYYPGSGELAEGINYWVYSALNEPVPYSA